MADRFIGFNTIYGANGEHSTPYLTRIWIGRLRFHIFHRGDADPDCHDHPWDFWTFPLTSYVEEVVRPVDPDFAYSQQTMFRRDLQVVPAWHLSHRPATHCHRVIGRYSWRLWSPLTKSVIPASPRLVNELIALRQGFIPHHDDRKIITIVWRGKPGRKWGFLRNRDGKWCWTPWREYVFGGGKHAPCEPMADDADG